MERFAVFSPCRTWRFSLMRIWDMKLPRLCFIMLNPSTADAYVDDATTRRVLDWAKVWGFGSYEAVNLFAFRSPSPKVMKQAPDPIGPTNDIHIRGAAKLAHLTVAAWGIDGDHRGRDLEVLELLKDIPLYSLSVTKDGSPGHPLYLKKELRPVLWRPAYV